MLVKETYRISSCLDHFEVDYDGEYNAEPLADLDRQIIDYADDQSYSRVLVDLSKAEGKLSLMGRYYLVNRMKEQWPKQLRTAVIVSPEQTLKAAGFIWARLSSYAGFSTGIFFDKREGLEWLHGSHAPVTND